MHCPIGELIFKKLSGRKMLKLINSRNFFCFGISPHARGALRPFGAGCHCNTIEKFFHWHLCQYFGKDARKREQAMQNHQLLHVLWIVGGTTRKSFISRQDYMDTVFFIVWKKCSVMQQEGNGDLPVAVVPSHGYFIHIKTLTHVLLHWLVSFKWDRCKYF